MLFNLTFSYAECHIVSNISLEKTKFANKILLNFQSENLLNEKEKNYWNPNILYLIMNAQFD